LPVVLSKVSEAGFPVNLIQGPELEKTISLDSSLTRLDRAKESRDGSDMGQGEALAALVKNGFTFNGQNLSGLNFDSVFAPDAVFDSADMTLSSLSGSDFSRGSFVDTGMKLVSAVGSTFAEADFSGAYGPLFEATGANFSKAIFNNANFYGADFQNAMFVGADLSGAGLAFADLRGADFTGANLDRTQFVGALLEGAIFKGAELSNTNMLASSLDAAVLSAEQVEGACRVSSPNNRFQSNRVDVMIATPSTKYDSGFAFDDLNSYSPPGPFPDGLTDNSLPLCIDDRERFNGFVPWSPVGIRVRLHSELLKPRSREKNILAAIDRFYARLEEGYSSGIYFKGNGRQAESWLTELSELAGRVSVDKIVPTASPDLVLAMLIGHDVLAPSEVNWAEAAAARHRNERTIFRKQSGSYAEHLAFPRLFPENSRFEDLPAESVELYKQWLLSYSEYPLERISFPLPTVRLLGEDFYSDNKGLTNDEAASLRSGSSKPVPLQTRLETSRFTISKNALGQDIGKSWSSSLSSAVKRLRGDLSTAAHVPVQMESIGVGEIVMLLPDSVYSYKFDLPDTLPISKIPERNADLRAMVVVNSIQRLEGRSYRPMFAMIVSDPKAELYIDGERVAMGLLISSQ